MHAQLERITRWVVRLQHARQRQHAGRWPHTALGLGAARIRAVNSDATVV